MSDVGTNLQLVRGDRSQTWLADRMREKGWRWSQPTVSAIEKGERALQFAEAVDLVDVLGLSSLDSLTDFPLRIVARSALSRMREAVGDAEEAVARVKVCRFEMQRVSERIHAEGEEFPDGPAVWKHYVGQDAYLGWEAVDESFLETAP